MMLPSRMLELVNDVELNNDVNRRFLGIDVWPVLRNTLLTIKTRAPAVIKKPVSIVDLFKSVGQLLILVASPKKLDVIALTDLKFTEKLSGRYCFKEAHVLSEQARAAGKSSLILTQSKDKAQLGYEPHKSLSFLVFISQLFARFLVFVAGKKIRSYVNSIVTSFENASYGEAVEKKDVNKNLITRNIFFVVVAAFLFKILLKRLSPSECYVVCYYSPVGMAFCSACNQLQIPVTDIQHGVSGRNMRAYSKWNKVPISGYNTLPSSFACWTEFDQVAVEPWARETNGKCKAVVTGNIWRDFFVQTAEFKSMLASNELNNLLNDCNKVILITSADSILDPMLISLIENSPDNYTYLIRLHPDLKRQNLIDIEMSFGLPELNCNVMVVQPTLLPLQLVLRYIDVHITEWSAVVYDAFFESVPSIVITEEGRDYFEGFIEKGLASYCSDVACILDQIKSLPPRLDYQKL